MSHTQISLQQWKENPFFIMHQVVHLLDKFADAELQKTLNISYSTYLFLLMLEKNPACSQRFLAECLGCSQAAVSKYVSGLVRNSLVESHPDEGNRRAHVLTLTSQGEHIVQQAHSILLHHTHGLLDDVPAASSPQFAETLSLLLSFLTTHSHTL